MDIKRMMQSLAKGMPTIDDRAAPIPDIVRHLLRADGHPPHEIERLMKLEALVVLQFVKFGELLELLENGRIKNQKPSTTGEQAP